MGHSRQQPGAPTQAPCVERCCGVDVTRNREIGGGDDLARMAVQIPSGLDPGEHDPTKRSN